jgi:Xaa-Pro aminopeptidase
MKNQRLINLQKALKAISCDALIVDDPINLYYLTGMQLSTGLLLAYSKGAYLIVDNRYSENCKKNCPFPVLLAESDQKTLVHLLLNECSSVKTLGFSMEDTTYKSYLDLQKCIESIPDRSINLKPVSSPLKKLRAIKDAQEIEVLQAAAKLGSEGYDYVCTLLKEGISESEVAAELEIFWKRHGGKGLAFEPIIAFGANSSMPHYRAGDTKLKKGDIVLIDIGVNFKHYHSDMTRVVFFGDVDPELKKIYAIVKEAQQAALNLCKPGTLIGSLDQTAREIIAAKGYGERFTHSLGHGVGLEIHEWPMLRNAAPFKDVPLQAGMVITIEPGIYLPGKGGVRLENTVVITDEGYVDLTKREV